MDIDRSIWSCDYLQVSANEQFNLDPDEQCASYGQLIGVLMAIQRQTLQLSFDGDLDTKSDAFQVAPNNFLSFNNAVRTTGKLFKKRNAFQTLATFNTPYATSLATFGGGLVGIGSSVQVYSPDTSQIIKRGTFQPVDLSVIPAIRNSYSQTTADVAIAPNGLACVVASQSQTSGNNCIYQIIDSVTGNIITPITVLTSSNYISSPRVFILGTYFIITFVNSSTNQLQYLPIPYASPNSPGSYTNIILTAGPSSSYECLSANGVLYIAAVTNALTHIGILILGPTLILGGVTTIVTINTAQGISVAVDNITANVWVTWFEYNFGLNNAIVNTTAFSPVLVAILTTTTLYNQTITNLSTEYITSVANNSTLTAFFSVEYPYTYTGATAVSDKILIAKCTQGGSVTPGSTLINSVGLASKAFFNVATGVTYMLVIYNGVYQPTYFLIDDSANILGKLAYSNATSPDNTARVLSSVNLSGSTVHIAYLFKDTLEAVNKSTLSAGNANTIGGLFAQSGVNIATFTLGASDTVSTEIGGSLQMSGGYLWMFDGQKPVEQNFHLWPELLPASGSSTGPQAVWNSSGGSMGPQPDGSTNTLAYAYQATYEWTDAAGNIHRSAPSVPIFVTTTGTGTTGSGSVTLYVPTLRLTQKISPNPVRIVIYRWSVKNQVYFQITNLTSVTSASNPLIINDTTIDYITYTDKLNDSSVIGGNILYTNGGLAENIGPPATNVLSLFDSRLWLVKAEDPNLLLFSKQVIENTPVEMSDLFTLYIGPSTSSQVSTGPTSALAPMDDKLIIFKANAAYYINGTGPDNTGNSNQYSQPIFITGTVGCSNPKSIVLMPEGLIFQSSQGMYLLGRDLSARYIGAPVEAYNQYTVTSAVNVPNTTQVRFTLSNGVELVYDYFYQKWDTCTPPSAISSVIYQGLHTFLDASGNIWQENVGSYVDGANPVNLSFTSPWFNLTGLQGYERAYCFYLLGTYVSPHTLLVQISYDYETSPSETLTIYPSNYGTSSTLEQWRIFFKKQRCQAFKITVTEAYDSTKGPSAGAGLTISGLNLVYGVRKAYRPMPASQSTGAT